MTDRTRNKIMLAFCYLFMIAVFVGAIVAWPIRYEKPPAQTEGAK